MVCYQHTISILSWVGSPELQPHSIRVWNEGPFSSKEILFARPWKIWFPWENPADSWRRRKWIKRIIHKSRLHDVLCCALQRSNIRSSNQRCAHSASMPPQSLLQERSEGRVEGTRDGEHSVWAEAGVGSGSWWAPGQEHQPAIPTRRRAPLPPLLAFHDSKLKKGPALGPFISLYVWVRMLPSSMGSIILHSYQSMQTRILPFNRILLRLEHGRDDGNRDSSIIINGKRLDHSQSMHSQRWDQGLEKYMSELERNCAIS